MTIEELEQRLAEKQSRLREIEADHAGQQLPDEARSEWETVEGEIESTRSELDEQVFRRDRVAELAGDEDHEDREQRPDVPQTRRSGVARGNDIFDLSTIRTAVGSPQDAARELRDRAQRANEMASFPHPAAQREATQEHIERLIERLDGTDESRGEFSRHLLATGSPAYRRAFSKSLGQRGLNSEEQRAMNLAGETGGFLLPFTLDPTIIPTSNGVRNPLRSISRVEQTLTDTWKGVTSSGGTAAYREAEGEETTDDSPKFAQPEVDCHAADFFAQWTYEFGQDYGSIESELAVMVQKAKDTLEATKLLSGSGEKEPFGVLTGAEEILKTAEAGKFGVADLYTLEEALADTDFGVNARFVAKRAIYNLIRQFDTQGGADLWVRLAEGFNRQADGALGQGLLGYLTYELSTMAGELAVEEAGQKILLFGDFDYYLIADRIGMTAQPISNVPGENGRPTGQAGLYFFWRNGAKVLSKAAFRVLQVK